MPFTENKFNSEALGETKTFAVAEHSADALRERINRDNSQSLRGRETRGGSVRSGAAPAEGNAPAGQADADDFMVGAQAAGSGAFRSESTGDDELPLSLEELLRSVEAADEANSAAPSGLILDDGPDDDGSFDFLLPVSAESARKPVQASGQKQLRTSDVRSRMGEDRRMTKTRTSDFKVDGTAVKTDGRKKKKEPEYEPSDEGGNTVLSVIKAIVYIIFVLVSAVALSVFGISVANDIFAFVKSDEAVQVTVPQNATLDELATILSDRDVIRYPRIFKFYAMYKKDDMEYVAGDYTVSPMMNYSTLLAEFKEKEVTGTVRITIPEGYTTDDIIDLFVDRYGIGTREGFVDVIQNGEFDYWFVRELEENGTSPHRIYRLDGYLFPDTYEFYLNSSEYTVINRLLRRFSQIFTREYRNQCAELGFTVDQIVTLASMIEKEAAAPSEFFNVSSVFHNRLKMPDVFPRMESDATVVYAIEHETGERTVDLYYNTRYNTYMYDGLPPGPIANPSASAMLAALMVPETSFYYFVSDGSVTYFSETKEEHDQNIENIRQAGRAVYVPEPDSPPTPAEETP